MAEGAERVAMLPGRLPDARHRGARRAIGRIAPDACLIIPDRHGTGTNGLVLAPPDVFLPAFGPDSCARHVSRARGRGDQLRPRAGRSHGSRPRHARGLLAAARPPAARPAARRRGPPRCSGSSASARSRPPRRSRGGVACAAMTGTTRELRIRPLTGIPELREGDQLGRLIAEPAHPRRTRSSSSPRRPSRRSRGGFGCSPRSSPAGAPWSWPPSSDKDPAMVELVLAESARSSEPSAGS